MPETLYRYSTALQRVEQCLRKTMKNAVENDVKSKAEMSSSIGRQSINDIATGYCEQLRN